MSTDYYMVCPKCKMVAQIFRYTAGGFNPPNGLKVHDFFLSHSTCEGFMPAVREQTELIEKAIDEDWVLMETYGDGRDCNEGMHWASECPWPPPEEKE